MSNAQPTGLLVLCLVWPQHWWIFHISNQTLMVSVIRPSFCLSEESGNQTKTEIEGTRELVGELYKDTEGGRED